MNEKQVIEKKKSKLRARSLKEKCTFKPDIGEFNRQLAETGESEEEFLNRMTHSNAATEQEIENMRQEIKFFQEMYDAKSQQELYKPKISHYEGMENHDRKMQGYKNVFEALHEEARILKEKKQNLKAATKVHKKQISEQYRESTKNPNSDKVLLKARRQKLKVIFDQLDSDQDGYISTQRIDLSQLSNELLDLLTPVFLQMEENDNKVGQTMLYDFDTFFSLCNFNGKNMILRPDRKLLKSPPSEPVFTPELTANTRAIMQYTQKEHRKVKLWEPKSPPVPANKENEELEGCTFHPQTLDYNPRKYKKGITSQMGLKETLVHTMLNK